MSSKTTNLYGALRSRILGFDPDGADTALSASFAGGLHTLAAPDNATFPFGLLRLQNRRDGRLDDAGMEEEGEIELMMFGRNRTQLIQVERAMDIAEEALLNWSTDQCGWLSVRSKMYRNTMPPYRDPSDSEIVQVRTVWRYTWWPTYRTQYAVAAGSPAP